MTHSGHAEATTVVADATVLIFLGKLRRLVWLRAMYDRVLIPPTVYTEVVEQGKKLGAEDAVLVEEAIDDGWIDVREVDSMEKIEKYDLEAGETEVLSLAVAEAYDVVLVDEESAREVARLHDLRPKGTLSFLFVAVRDGRITFEEFIELLERLLAEGFYLDESIYLKAIRRGRQLATDES